MGTAAETQERILDAAVRLFASHGFRGTSLRAVTSRAGVNLAAVHYHFGSKQALLYAAVGRSIAPINAQRLASLEALEAAPSAPSVEAILAALLRPAVEAVPVETAHAIVALLYTESQEIVQPLLRELFGEIESRFVPALAAALPHLDRAAVTTRFQLVIGSMTHVLSRRFRWSPSFASPDEAPSDAEVLEQMIAFLAAGLRAPRLAAARRDEDAA